jgi:hypothetical protein
MNLKGLILVSFDTVIHKTNRSVSGIKLSLDSPPIVCNNTINMDHDMCNNVKKSHEMVSN